VIVSSGAPPDAPADWDDQLADPQARWGRAVLDRLKLAGTETALDAGCGSGRVTGELLGRLPAGRVVALDASASMLTQARALTLLRCPTGHQKGRPQACRHP